MLANLKIETATQIADSLPDLPITPLPIENEWVIDTLGITRIDSTTELKNYVENNKKRTTIFFENKERWEPFHLENLLGQWNSHQIIIRKI